MESVRCSICSDVYNVGSHDPLVLPCGHTFCRECIANLCKNSRIECPVCRRTHTIIGMGFLPKNFALLSLSTTKYMPEVCKTHGDPLRFWCNDCREQVCGICMFEGHPKDDHHVVRTTTLMDDKKKSIEMEAKQLLHLARTETRSHEKLYSRYEKKLLRLLKTNRDICYLHDQVTTLLQAAMESTGIQQVLESEANLKKLHANTQKVMATSGLICQNRKYTDETDTESGNRVNMLQCNNESFASTLAFHVRCINGGNGSLKWDKERLLLFTASAGDTSSSPGGIQMIAASSSAASSLKKEMNTEVFLDLSIGDHLLGRVYIRLYGHLRRAQHFLALCAGTFGPSFKGSHLVAVKRRNEPEESVAGGDYLTPEGTVTSRALMTDLEWGGAFAAERREGLVVGSSGGYVDEDARFGISTSKTAAGQCQCPFGEVVEGLEVVRKTLNLDNVSRVMIKECGLVVLQQPL